MIGLALEGVFQPLKRLACVTAALQGDNVETAGVIGPAGLLLQEKRGSKRQSFLLAPIDTAEGAAEVRM